MLEKWHDVILKSLLFSDISQKELALMLKCLNPWVNRYKKGESIARWSEPVKGMGVLLEGSVAILKETVDGNRLIMNVLKPGDMFGEMAIFSECKLWPSGSAALEDSTVLFIPPGKIVESCPNACLFHRRLIVNMLKTVSEKALNLNRKVEYLSIKGMRAKLCTFFWEEYKRQGKTLFTLSMKRNELADFLNVSRPSMSREMSRMRDEGLIDFHLSAIKIINPEKVALYVH